MKRSVRIEIVASFATLVVALGLVGGYALVRQAQAVEMLALENQGYLPLSGLLFEVNATQDEMNTLLERFVEVPDAAWRVWINGARRTRRAKIRSARALAQSAQRDAQATEDRELLTRVERALERVDTTYRDDERDFSLLFDALAANDSAGALAAHRPLFAREQATEGDLRELSRAVAARMGELANNAKREQPRTLRVLSIVTVLAFAIGLMTLLSAYRALRPLKLLIERVRAVAGGDLSPRVVAARPDEIGELAREFDRMVEAVKERDTALREKADEIRRAEEHLEQVVATLRAAVMVVSKDGVLTSANPAAHRIADARMSAGIRFAATPFGAVEEIERAVAATCAGERTSGASLLAIPMGQRALDVAVATFVAPGGLGSGALVVADDVTEREQARARLLQNERLAAIGRMAAHVTHEVRNPLSSMALNAEMLADEARGIGEPGREVQRLVTAIQQEIDRLTLITEEYLRVARLPRPRLEREDVLAVVEDAANFVGAEFSRAGIALTIVPRGTIPAAMIDEGQIRQALLNLLRNAREVLEAQPPGQRAVHITVSSERDGIEVALADSGPGIRPEVRAHLFELFFTTKERGTGLGLPLTREVIAAHGGTIAVTAASTDEGGGAKFVIWLPSAPAHQASPDGGTRDAA